MPTAKILVPLDGSHTSEAALPFAESVAQRTHATLALIRAVDKESMKAVAEAERYLEAVANQLTDRGLTVETGVPYGSAADWIVDEVSWRSADMVIMATHDRTGRDRLLHGSVAEAVISRAPVPVLVVRAAGGMRPAERFGQRQPLLVVALDGSELAEAAMPFAAELATEMGGKLVLVSVVPPVGPIVYPEGVALPQSDEDTETFRRQAQSYLDGVVDPSGCDVVLARAVRLGDPATEIADEANERGAALVVMATHGRTGVMRSLLGSVAGQVVHTGTVPVALVRPAMLRAAEAPAAHSALVGAAG